MSETHPILGHRIVVWGVTGSGKTTLARQLGYTLALPVVELDAIRHRNGWDTTDWPEFRAELEATPDRYNDGWVLEGSYSPVMDIYLGRADMLIWLNLPWRVTFWHLLQRTVKRAWDKQPLYNPDGPRESWRLSFLDRRSILWWSISQHRRIRHNHRERIAALPPHITVHELRSPRQVEAFVRWLEAQNKAMKASSPIPD